VVLGSLYFVRVPLLRFVSSVRELLMMAPADHIKETLQTRLDEIANVHGFDGAIVRSAKVGRELTVDIAFLVPHDFGKVDIDQLDSIRTEVKDNLSGLGYKVWMNVLFPKDRYWA
jgi:predicted Co/Zn/Cd cation transporter (cation efflux family)